MHILCNHPQYRSAHLLQPEPAFRRQQLILRRLRVGIDHREHREPIFLREGPLNRFLFLLAKLELSVEALYRRLGVFHLALQRDLELLFLLTESCLQFVQDSWET